MKVGGVTLPSWQKVKDTTADAAKTYATGGYSKIYDYLSDKEKSEKNKADDQQKAKDVSDEFYKNTQGHNKELDTEGKKYLDNMDSSHNDASKVYTQTVKPNLQNLMERAHQDSDSSMSLKDSMDPNNKVASGTRKLYEDQAANEGRSGLAATSLASSLGMQNMAGQMGSMGPLSGGQLAAMMGQNQASAGRAFGQTQRRQQNLSDTGLDMGFRRSDLAYDRGIDAQSRFGQATGNYDSAFARDRASNEANYGLHNAVGMQSKLRQQAADTAKYGGDMSQINAQIAGENAKQQNQADYAKGAIKAVGTIGGAYVGGPQGAAAGYKAGDAAGNEVVDEPSDDDGEVDSIDTEAPKEDGSGRTVNNRQATRALDKYRMKRQA